MIEILMILLGLIFSYFLKDINFLSLQFSFLNSEIIYPDFLILFLIFFSLRSSEVLGIWIGFFAGLLEDSTILKFSKTEFHPLLGMHTLVYPIVGYILSKFKRFLDINNTGVAIFVTFIAAFSTRTFVWLLMGIMDNFYQSYSILATSLYTSLLAPVWFLLLKWTYYKKEL
ncbi:MAG: rod shape-determining protein MreD [Leptonema sp. (in: bacteria)]